MMGARDLDQPQERQMDFMFPGIRWACYLLAASAAQPLSSMAAPAAESGIKSEQPGQLRHPAVDFDAAGLREGKFTYQLSIEGKPLGVAIIEIRNAGKDECTVTFSSKDIDQSWRSSFGPRLTPLAATLDMPKGESPYSMSLRYSGKGVSGTESAKGSSKPVAATFDRQVIDQRVDWAAMMAAEIPNGKSVEFAVYDPGTGLSRLVGSAAESKPVGGVLGDLPTTRLDYTIHKEDHTESYSVYATKSKPRIMLREEMPGGLLSVLVAMEK